MTQVNSDLKKGAIMSIRGEVGRKSRNRHIDKVKGGYRIHSRLILHAGLRIMTQFNLPIIRHVLLRARRYHLQINLKRKITVARLRRTSIMFHRLIAISLGLLRLFLALPRSTFLFLAPKLQLSNGQFLGLLCRNHSYVKYGLSYIYVYNVILHCLLVGLL